jgi:hypothetical protein
LDPIGHICVICLFVMLEICYKYILGVEKKALYWSQKTLEVEQWSLPNPGLQRGEIFFICLKNTWSYCWCTAQNLLVLLICLFLCIRFSPNAPWLASPLSSIYLSLQCIISLFSSLTPHPPSSLYFYPR